MLLSLRLFIISLLFSVLVIRSVASDFRDESYAWEQWEDNTWHNFKNSWNGTLNVDLAVYPLVCKQLPPYDLQKPVVMTLGPNPLN